MFIYKALEDGWTVVKIDTDKYEFSKKFDNIANESKIILTTEKDAMRLAIPGVARAFENLPVFYLPIKIKFQDEDGDKFNELIIDYVTKN